MIEEPVQSLGERIKFLHGVFEDEVVFDIKQFDDEKERVEGEKLPERPDFCANHRGEKQRPEEEGDEQVNEALVLESGGLGEVMAEEQTGARVRVGMRIAGGLKFGERAGDKGEVVFELFFHDDADPDAQVARWSGRED
jgi:hypothetical protein